MLTRRDFLGGALKAGAGALALSANPLSLLAANGREDMEPFHWARLKFKVVEQVPDKWDVHPWGDKFFLEMLHKHTRLNVDRGWNTPSIERLDEMVKYPFLFMTSEGDFEFTKQDQKNFVEYLARGGFIFADDCVFQASNQPGRGDRFFLCAKNKIETLFGEKMTPLPNNHEIYKSYFQLAGLPYLQGVPHPGEALFIDGRMAVFLTSTDIHCGWCSMSLISQGQDKWFSRNKSMDAVKMGINVLVYAMTR